MTTYTTTHNATRGFRRNYAHLASLSNDMILCDFVNVGPTAVTISLEAVADYEADRMGALRTTTYLDVPAVRRSNQRKGATARVRAFFASLPAMPRKNAIVLAVEAGFAYCTARTQYQVWKNA